MYTQGFLLWNCSWEQTTRGSLSAENTFALNNYYTPFVKIYSDSVLFNEACVYVLIQRGLWDIQLLKEGERYVQKSLYKYFFVSGQCLFLLREQSLCGMLLEECVSSTLPEGKLTCFKLIGIFYYVTMCICYFHNTT